MKKLILALVLILGLMISPAMAEEAQPTQWAKFGIDLSGDVVYLTKSHKVVAGIGLTPVSFVDGIVALRIEYTNDMQGDMLSNDLVGGFILADIVQSIKLIPNAKWSLPDIGVKLGIGYMDDIEKFDFKDGEPAVVLQVIKLF